MNFFLLLQGRINILFLIPYHILLSIFSEISTKDATTCILHDFLIESQHIHISALCLVLKFDEELISNDEKIIAEVSCQILLTKLLTNN